MLEKIGLPPKPSLRGNNWVADASHCQGCSCQFTFINRKHHCRRCGGLFCNSCTQQRMVLRGQSDSPVRICEPCKKLEEAARFELRQGRRAGKGSLKSASRYEDEVLNQILGHDRDQSFSSGNQSTNEIVPNTSSSSTKGLTNQVDRDMQNIISNDNPNNMEIDMGSTTPEDLHQQAVEEKKKYKILKGDGKPEEALKAFKRGKELERQANALEIHLRKIRKRISSSGNAFDMQTRDKSLESGKKTKSLPHMDNEKHDVTAELRELGWSDVDIRDEDRKSANLSLEGELSSILGEVTPKTGGDKGSRTDKTQVVALKKKALSLKREGKLAEAKEELKRAKVLEKQLEEQELLAEAEDSDDELSALIRGMDNDNEGSSNLHDHKHDFDFDRLLGISDDVDGNFEVTDEDMMDPEIAVALESLGWTEDSNRHANTSSESQPLDRETLLSEIQSLKREALKQKRVGNAEEAMAFLKKAKLLERELNSYGSQENHTTLQKSTAASSQIPGKGSDFIQLGARDTNAINNADSMLAPKSRLMIQRELLSVKKKALTLRREGKLNEAEAELQKGAALEHQLDEMDKSSSRIVSQLNIGGNAPYTAYKQPDIHRDLPFGEGEEEDVTDQDLSDPTYLSLLTDLGWNDDNNEPSKSSTEPSKPSTKDDDHFVPISDVSVSQHSTNVLVGAPRRSKFEIQRELLGLKRKALALRREGKVEDAEEMLKMAKELEGKIAEMEAPKKEVQVEATRKDKLSNPPVGSAIEEESHVAFTEEDMHDPALDSMLINLGLKDEELKPGSIKEESFKKADSSFAATVDLSVLDSSSSISGAASRSKGEIQKLLELKRKALALRRKGEVEEAEEILRMAKSLEVQMEDGGNQNKEDPLSFSTNEKPIFSESSDLHEMHGSLGVAREVDGCSASSGVGQSSVMVSASNETIGYSTSAEHSMNSPDLLTDSEILIRKQREESKIRSANLPLVGHPISLDTFMTLNQDQGHKNNVTTIKRGELTDAHENPSISETTAQDNASQHHISFHQEILAHKRKAVSLKREGKLAEAREELRQAKLLEKSFENDNMQPKTASRITSNASNVEQKNDSSNIAVKPLSSRDRFKLQQESLGHKRQALKLRREGRMEEAEAEFERAKALETQLDELTAHDAGKSSASLSDSVDDVTVDDFLDPQLLSALKEVGLEDVSVVTRGPEINEPVKSNVSKIENLTQEKIQLEERIKAEKMKAVNLKRQGKQAEALDALRRAKMYEKKMNSITSG